MIDCPICDDYHANRIAILEAHTPDEIEDLTDTDDRTYT